MFQQILVPLDGSTASFNALDWAIEIALTQESSITALCVIDERVAHEAQLYLPILDEIGVSNEHLAPTELASTYQQWAEGVIDRAEKRASAVRVEIRPEIMRGIPHEKIVSRCSMHDLLVMGGWKMADDYPGPFLAGSTFWQVVANTELPAFHVASEPRKIETILAAYDDNPEAQDALQLAATWAKVGDLKLVVLTVQSDGDQAQALLQQAHQRVAPLNPRLIARDGNPGEVIKEIAGQYQCDLISLGVPPHRLWQGHSLGSVIDNLVHNGNIPLLLSH